MHSEFIPITGVLVVSMPTLHSSGGTQVGTAIYSIFDADPTTYHELIGNITRKPSQQQLILWLRLMIARKAFKK